MTLLAKTEAEAEKAWKQLQTEFEALKLTVNQEKSKITGVESGFKFLGFDFRKKKGKLLYLQPCKKAKKNVVKRVREVTRSFHSSESLATVIKALNAVLIGWCTYFRVGNSNRVFHWVDWSVRSELQIWLRYKHQCSWIRAKARWNYKLLHEKCQLYRLVGKVSHLEGLRRKLPEEGGRRAGYGKTVCPVR
jgi:RNA-directed DNA polymerase